MITNRYKPLAPGDTNNLTQVSGLFFHSCQFKRIPSGGNARNRAVARIGEILGLFGQEINTGVF